MTKRQPSSEAYITFLVTQSCQLRCRYCYLVGKNSFGKMNEKTARQAVDYLLSDPKLTSKEMVTFDFIGGEPLLEIELINLTMDYILTRIEQKGLPWADNYRINITTNGLMYSEPSVQDFIRNYKEHLNISISIDGNAEKHNMNRIYASGKGSFDEIIPNVQLWLQQFPKANTRMTIAHHDLQYVAQSLTYLIELGIKNIDVNPVLEDVWEKGDDVILESQLKAFADYLIDNNLWKECIISCFDGALGHPLDPNELTNPCGADVITIDAKGDLYPCLRFAQFSLRNKQARSVGNIANGIDWNKMRPFETISPSALLANDCIKCPIASGCKHCPAENYDCSATDSIFDRSTAACHMHRAKVNAKEYFFKKVNENN